MGSKLILYIACSLDGFIADASGGISFLYDTPNPDPDLGYEAFYASVDALIMGGKTYRQVAQELAPEGWPYAGKPCYVYSGQALPQSEGILPAKLPPKEQLAHISRTVRGDIWLVGGGDVIRQFMQDELIDKYYIYVMPNLLGAGIPLFPAGFPRADIHLDAVQQIGQIAELVYSRVGDCGTNSHNKQ